MSRSPLLLLSLLAVGCNSQHLVGTNTSPGYLSSDACTKHADQISCAGDVAGNCGWLAPTCPAGVQCPTGVCVQRDPCLQIDDEAACKAKSGCAWAQAGVLCPLGATCPNQGYCHAQDPSGGTCSCVTPLLCPQGAACPPPTCDCSGGGSGGGTCTCGAPACAPGQACPPATCQCSPGSVDGGTGCVTGGTCTCACPACAPGQMCPPCNCSCGAGGAVPAPQPLPPTNPGTPTPDGGMTAPSDPCRVHSDQMTCAGDSANKCQWFVFGAPCMAGTTCSSGVCQSPPPGSGPCGCACPSCAPGQPCPPCQCNCPPPIPGGGCTPPPVGPPSPPTCAGVMCAIACPNGFKKDPSGCPICQCA